MAKGSEKLRRAQRKSISPVLSSLGSADRAAQIQIRKDLVAKAKAKRAKAKPKPKAKPKKRKRTRTVLGVAKLLQGKGTLE
jgi:hypothetical protein